MSRILLTGSSGQVGFELLRCLAGIGQIIAPDRQELDLADPEAIRRAVRAAQPDLIINAAAYTAVDEAEAQGPIALAVNATAPGILAEESQRVGAALIHYSTDYVFDGSKREPYTEEDVPRPISVYGRTKLAGEQAIEALGTPHLILRTSWVYGARGKNFLLTILRLARERNELSVVDDQIGAPTWSRAIAGATRAILRRLGYGEPGFAEACANRAGIYHLSAAGSTSWYGFAAAILARAASGACTDARLALDRVPVLKPIPSERYPLPAPRPRYSVLAHSRLRDAFGVSLPDWEDDLARCLLADVGPVSPQL